ncbi:MAG: NUDIX hydrolase [Simkaniaceae bacterium]|nr:NUDIX hydrolase [Candidatus Sacchlamyda saccharinae]
MDNSLKQKALEDSATIESEELHKGKIFTLRRDHITFDAQPPCDWDIIETLGAVALIPITKAGNLLLIRQWRRAIQKIIYELPAGTLEVGEDLQDCAQRELQEETGFKAEELIPFGGIYSSPGFCTEYIHLFIAKNLSKSPLPSDPHEGIDTEEVPLDRAIAMIGSGEITDAKTIAGILRYA